MKPKFFRTPAELRAWFHAHHDEASELWIGFYKKGSGTSSTIRSEAVDEALCFGWIDSRINGIDDATYAIRFTPRKPRSAWSTANVKRVRELAEAGRMTAAGLKAFELREKERSQIYSYEQRGGLRLEAADERKFRANRKAWNFFRAQAPSYRKAAIWWVLSAKAEETRLRRLARLIDDSEHERTIPPLTPSAKRT
jgi:uncharacterized protein YdeI (YjbR/CyaY-like superfamily)